MHEVPLNCVQRIHVGCWTGYSFRFYIDSVHLQTKLPCYIAVMYPDALKWLVSSVTVYRFLEGGGCVIDGMSSEVQLVCYSVIWGLCKVSFCKALLLSCD